MPARAYSARVVAKVKHREPRHSGAVFYFL